MSGESLLDTIKKTVLVPPHPAGIPFIGGGIIASLIFFTFSEFLGILALVFAVFCLYFFRDPNRMVPQKDSLILAPADGMISAIVKFLNADLDKASEDNERCSLIIESPMGQKICVVQIAGLIARRIINDAREEDTVTAGKRYGMIRFGSRLDVYIPEGISPLVVVGQRAIGGETVFADFDGDESPREGVLL